LNIKLNWLRIKHFKGIPDLLIDLSGQNAFFYAANGKGKTTTYDAFLWLLFGKDSSDRTSFQVKPLDGNNQEIHHLQTEVEAEFSIDGKPLRLKKMQEEDWQTPRGCPEPILKGNNTSYWWDEVPAKAGEYKKKIGELLDENVFRMITNPLYFNSSLKWQERRNIIMEMGEAISDEQVIASDKKLSKLAELLNGRTIEQYKKVASDKIVALKKERDDKKPRIDELMLGIPHEVTGYTATEQELKQQQEMLSGIELRLSSSNKKANEYQVKRQELYRLESQLDVLKKQIETDAGADRLKLQQTKNSKVSEIAELRGEIETLKSSISRWEQSISFCENDRTNLLAEWKELSAIKKDIATEQFVEPNSSFSCPTCKQALPVSDKVAKLKEMQDNFETYKQDRLKNVIDLIESNVKKGKLNAGVIESQKEFTKQAQEKIDKHLSTITFTTKELSDITAELENPACQVDFTQSADYNKLSASISALKTELDKPIEDTTATLLADKQAVQANIDSNKDLLRGKEQAEKDKKRIEELKEEEKRLSIQIAEFEGHKYLIEQFTVAKINLLEDSINSRFKHVKFKMFKENMTNDGIQEICEALVNTNGSYVPFADANTAGKYAAGMDCINALNDFYGVTAPIWIDGRESVTDLIDTNSQVISLVVSPKDKTLRVEV